MVVVSSDKSRSVVGRDRRLNNDATGSITGSYSYIFKEKYVQSTVLLVNAMGILTILLIPAKSPGPPTDLAARNTRLPP